MNKTYTCVLCPNSCEVNVEYCLAGGNAPGLSAAGATNRESSRMTDQKCGAAGSIQIERISGNHCPKGRAYAEQELLDPRRTIATSVLVEGGERPLVSVRLTAPVPLKEVLPLMETIRKIRLQAPVEPGQVLLRGVLGTEADLITTSRVKAR